MTSPKEAALIAIVMETERLATAEGLTCDRLNELREDAGVVEYYRLREEDETGRSAVKYMFGLPEETKKALTVLNTERVLMRQLAAAMRGE